jgi:ArsR family transcriptional regulator
VSRSESLVVEALPAAPDVGPGAAQLLKLLADRTRRQIFLLIMRGEVCNCELSGALGLPQNLVSHHIRKLRQAGFVEEHRDLHDGRWIHYTVNVESLTSAWNALRMALEPANIGTRLPACQQRGRAASNDIGATPPGERVGERADPL